MYRIQSILAATDFSRHSRYAAGRAAKLASATGAEKGVLLHVVERSWFDSLRTFITASDRIDQDNFGKASPTLAKIIRQAGTHSGFALTPEIRIGSVLGQIADLASEFDLLVLGARGLHPVRALALGTTSQRLLSKVRQPVLIVKRKPRKEYRNILVAIDFSPSSAGALTWGGIVAPGADIALAHVLEPLFEGTASIPEEDLQRYRAEEQLGAKTEMGRFIKQAGLRPANVLRIIEHGHVVTKLREIVARTNSDLVVVGRHGRSRVEELLLGGVALHMIAESKCDVLVSGMGNHE